MGSRALLFIDVDQTLCDSSPADHLLPKDPKDGSQPEAYTAWLDYIATTNFDPMPGAYRQVKTLLEMLDPVLVVILTARCETVRAGTRIWIDHHFPLLKEAELSMRPVMDVSRAAESKLTRIHPYRALHPLHPVYIMDDDPEMAMACEKANDRFILAGDQDQMQLVEEALKIAGGKR